MGCGGRRGGPCRRQQEVLLRRQLSGRPRCGERPAAPTQPFHRPGCRRSAGSHPPDSAIAPPGSRSSFFSCRLAVSEIRSVQAKLCDHLVEAVGLLFAFADALKSLSAQHGIFQVVEALFDELMKDSGLGTARDLSKVVQPCLHCWVQADRGGHAASCVAEGSLVELSWSLAHSVQRHVLAGPVTTEGKQQAFIDAVFRLGWPGARARRLRGEMSSRGTFGFRLDFGTEHTRCGV